jgi:hypothetical protein
VATKTEELIASVQVEVARALTQLESLKDEVRKADLIDVRESLAPLAVLNIPALLSQVATLQEQVTELKKWREERERRWWQFWLGVGICALTFTLNFAMNLVLFFARKPG